MQTSWVRTLQVGAALLGLFVLFVLNAYGQLPPPPPPEMPQQLLPPPSPELPSEPPPTHPPELPPELPSTHPPCTCVKPPSGLTAWWPLDEISGTVANDLALFNNQGTHVNGPKPIVGKVGVALSFDGKDDYVQVKDHHELNVGAGSFTIDAWVLTTWKGQKVVVLQDKRDKNAGYSLHLYRSVYTQGRAVPALNVTYTGVPPGFENHNAMSAPDVADGEWHHIAAVADVPKKEIRIYMDGVLVYTNTSKILGHNLDNKSDFYLGVRVPLHGGGGHFPGALDEVELFKRALTPAEIQKIYQAGCAGKCKPKKKAVDESESY